MGFLDNVELWEDVLDEGLDEKSAPGLGSVHLGMEEPVYTVPEEFYRRTLLTRYIVDAIDAVVDTLSGGGGSKILLLQSLFGGGKTHTLLAVYHAFRRPEALLEAKTDSAETRDRVRRLVDKLLGLGSVRIAVIDGHYHELAPSPVNPLEVPGGYRVQTVWGALAHQLGRYGEVRSNDETLYAPQADILRRVLGEEPVLILVDEIADYIVRLWSTGDETLKGYAESVVAFFEILAKAVDLSPRSVLLVSLPVGDANARKVEDRYKLYRDIIQRLYKSLTRVNAKRIVPVAPEDIPSILRVRLFKHINNDAARTVASALARVYSSDENRDLFGEGAVRVATRIVRTYPFHPSYIDTLVDIIDKHEGLQKTRDAIKITRKIVRKLAKTGSTSELVMPYHLDVEDREIQAILFSNETYRGYATVVNVDITGKAREYDRPEIAKIVAKTILVKTFVYTGILKYLQAYPDRHEVLVSSYEPSTARELKAQPKDYMDALEWASRNLVYLLNESGRYWFTIVTSPIKLVETQARQVGDQEALRKVKEYTWSLMTKPAGEILSGSRRRGGRGQPVAAPFNAANSLVLEEPERVDHDSREYILLAFLSPLRGEEIESIMYETPSGGLRRYANTVYLIYPRSNENLLQMLGFAKHLIACDMIRDEIDSLYPDNDMREIFRKKLEKYCKGMEGIEGNLVSNILAGLNTVAYPWFDDKASRNSYRTTSTPGADTIIEKAARALKTERPPKFYDNLDFEMLDHLLSQAGVSLPESDTPRLVSDIIDYFYSNPKLPMVRDETVRDAIIDGVIGLRIGVRRNGKVYFKKVYECTSTLDCNPPMSFEGEDPGDVGLNDVVLPWRTALKEQVDSLVAGEVEEKVNGGLRRVWHAFYVDGELVPVREAFERYDLETLLESPLVRISEFIEEGVDVKLDSYELTVSPGEEATITVLLERIGGFQGEAILEVSSGTLSTSKVSITEETPSATVEWRLKVPDEPGTYRYDIIVRGPNGREMKREILTVHVRPTSAAIEKGVPPRGAKLRFLEVNVPVFNFSPLKVIASRFSGNSEVEEAVLEMTVEVGDVKPRIVVRLEKATLEDIKSVFTVIASRYGAFAKSTSYRIRLVPKGGEYIVMPELSDNEVRDVREYIVYQAYEG